MDLFIYYYYALGVGGEDREIEEEKEGKERGEEWGGRETEDHPKLKE